MGQLAMNFMDVLPPPPPTRLMLLAFMVVAVRTA